MNQIRAVLPAAGILRRLAVAVAGAALLSVPAWADMVGSTVTGTVQFGAGPVYSLGTAVIQNGPIEFTYSDSINVDTVDFSSLNLAITDVSSSTWLGSGSAAATYTFTDTVFSGLSFVKLSDSFGGAQLSLTGDVITVTTPAFPTSGTFGAVFTDPPSVPEPRATLFLCFSVAILCFAKRKSLKLLR